MSLLEGAGLLVLHFLYVLWEALVVLFSQLKASQPQPLEVARNKLPSHLALVIADTGDTIGEEDGVVESICEAVRCCSIVGIENLSVYDRTGASVKCADRVRAKLMDTFWPMSIEADSSSESDLEYPLTPPASDSSGSRPLSPQEYFKDEPILVNMHLRKHNSDLRRKSRENRPLVKRRHSTGKSVDIYESGKKGSEVKLLILAYDASKPALASVARTFTRHRVSLGKSWEEQVENPATLIEAIDDNLRELTRLSPPDLMIVHHLKPGSLSQPALELDGFPPWSMRVTEIHREYSTPLHWSRAREVSASNGILKLSEETFRRALDGFASAELRMGK